MQPMSTLWMEKGMGYQSWSCVLCSTKHSLFSMPLHACKVAHLHCDHCSQGFPTLSGLWHHITHSTVCHAIALLNTTGGQWHHQQVPHSPDINDAPDSDIQDNPEDGQWTHAQDEPNNALDIDIKASHNMDRGEDKGDHQQYGQYFPRYTQVFEEHAMEEVLGWAKTAFEKMEDF